MQKSRNSNTIPENNLDLLRHLAALQVMFMHSVEHLDIKINPWLHKVLFLFPGVPIFFFISGFLISASYENSQSIKAYFKNRFYRIYPGLWTCFAFTVFTILVIFKPTFTLSEFCLWVTAQLTFFQFYNPKFLQNFGIGVINGSLWTIPVELQFYIIAPFLIKYLNLLKWKISGLIIAILLLMFLNLAENIFESDPESIYWKIYGITILPYLYMFLIGIIFQKYRILINIFKNKFFFLLLGYLILCISVPKIELVKFGPNLNPLCVIALFYLVASFAFSYTNFLKKFKPRFDISYGIYIYHMIYVNILIHLQIFNSIINLLLVCFLTLLSAYASWNFIEKPAMRRKSYSIRTTHQNN